MTSLLLALPAAWALPEAPDLFCAHYPDVPFCLTDSVSCTMCHAQSGPPTLNPYGADVQAELGSYDELADVIDAALTAVEPLDSDADGVDNLTEILLGAWPGLADDEEPECSAQVSAGLQPNPWYRLGTWDPVFAWRRVSVDFCGVPATREELEAIAVDPDPQQAVLDLLETCLDSEHWQETIDEIGAPVVMRASDVGDENWLGNCDWDERLWRWAMIDHHDAGDVLQAQYFVVEDPGSPSGLMRIEEPRNETESFAQPMEREHRFGLMTTRYSLTFHIMERDVPRNLVVHFYRELLGLDIALGEGLYPIDEQPGVFDWPAPLDVDGLGVWQEACAVCHTTIDPLSYPWMRYWGIDTSTGMTALYDPERNLDMYPTEEGHIFGQPIDGPAEWVQAAVESDFFAQQVVRMFWKHLLRRDVYSCEQDTFDQLWMDFRDNGRDVEAMLAEFVLTDAYGAP